MGLNGPYSALELIGTIAFAVSGGAVAVRAGMDWLGVGVLAVVTAVGGGTLRDLLLGQFPINWIQHPWPVWVAFGTAVVVIAVAYWHPHHAPDSSTLLLIADAAGLAVFTVTGTLLALAHHTSGPVAVLLGVVTGAAGGVMRDVLARQTPLILVGQIYALSAALGAILLVILHDTHAPTQLTRWLAVAAVFVIRVLAIHFSWSLPHLPAASPQDAGDDARPVQLGSGEAAR